MLDASWIMPAVEVLPKVADSCRAIEEMKATVSPGDIMDPGPIPSSKHGADEVNAPGFQELQIKEMERTLSVFTGARDTSEAWPAYLRMLDRRARSRGLTEARKACVLARKLGGEAEAAMEDLSEEQLGLYVEDKEPATLANANTWADKWLIVTRSGPQEEEDRAGAVCAYVNNGPDRSSRKASAGVGRGLPMWSRKRGGRARQIGEAVEVIVATGGLIDGLV